MYATFELRCNCPEGQVKAHLGICLAKASIAGRGSLLNTEGWSDFAADEWLQREFPALRERRGGALIASLGYTPKDVGELAGPVAKVGLDMLELVSYWAEDVVEMVMAGATAVGVHSLPLLRGLGWFGKTLSRADKETRFCRVAYRKNLVSNALPYPRSRAINRPRSRSPMNSPSRTSTWPRLSTSRGQPWMCMPS